MKEVCSYRYTSRELGTRLTRRLRLLPPVALLYAIVQTLFPSATDTWAPSGTTSSPHVTLLVLLIRKSRNRLMRQYHTAFISHMAQLENRFRQLKLS